jgi:hypothetical protein
MKLECPKCDSNVVQILTGVDDSRYTQCLGCGWLTQIKRERVVSEPSLLQAYGCEFPPTLTT